MLLFENNDQISYDYETSYFKTRGVSLDTFKVFDLFNLKHHKIFGDNLPVFPIKDLLGNLVSYGIRTEQINLKYFYTSFKKHKILYGLNVTYKSILEKDAVYIVEGPFDLLVPYSVGITNIVSVLGSTMSKYQTLMLASFTKNFIFSFDADRVGISSSFNLQSKIKLWAPDVSVLLKTPYPFKDFASKYACD